VSDREAAEARHASAIADLVSRSRALDEALRVAREDADARGAEVRNRIEREADLTAMLADAGMRQADLERRLAATEATVADTEAALRDAQQRHAAASIAADRDRADRQAEFDRGLARVQAARDSLSERLNDAETALERARDAHQSATAQIEQLTQREAHLSSELRDMQSGRDELARRFADAQTDLEASATRERETTRQIEEERAARASAEQALADANARLDAMRRERAAAAAEVEHLTRREAELLEQLADTEAVRDCFEVRLSHAAKAVAELGERAAVERRGAADRRQDLERRLGEAVDGRDELERVLTQIRSAAKEAEGVLTESVRQLTLERDSLLQSLGAAEERFRRLDDEHRNACLQFEQDRASAAGDIARLTAERVDLERTLGAVRSDFEDTVQRLSTDHATALAARDAAIDQLQAHIVDVTETLKSAQQRVEVLQPEADRVPQLLRERDDSRAEKARLVGQAPVPMFQCARDGTLVHANRAWATLVRRTVDELTTTDCAAAVFESPGDLTWLIGRCVSTGTRESIETTVRREDGARLFVRLTAWPSGSHAVQFVAEDLTRPRILEDRLARAGRMEAVGRFASEIALTCGRLLGDIRETAEEWLVRSDATGASPRRREMLLEDLSRAADYLQQLVAYGGKQTRAGGLVDLHAVVRDLVPVLKHVAGDDVEVRLPDAAASLTVDVDPERVERLLVNVAACGRDRMPFGGRLTIEVGTSIVDRQFAARYPNVRPGRHALITVTEARRAAPASDLLQLRDAPAARTRSAVVQKPTVDLATLQGLVGECGGHLWMKVQPLGDMVAKIRLPLLTSYGQAEAAASAAAGGRGSLTRWFRH
jgi:hypothetical protein